MTKRHKSSHSGLSKTKSAKQRNNRQRYWIWLGIGLGVVVLAAAVFLLTRPKAAMSAEISAAQAYEKFQNGAFFLDVRPAEEWAQVHIANSTQIALDELQSRLSQLPQDRDIVVVCLSGVRSKAGLALLQQAGFKQAFCLNGGIEAWKAAGYPVEGNAP